MTPDDNPAWEAARQSRDPRFDGRFFIGVRTTGIYCRPTCPVRMPRARNVRFYPTAAAASEDGFRPCLRCRPETAAPMPDRAQRSSLVRRALRLIADGDAEDGGIAAIADRLGVSSRHLGRIFQAELGASPLAVVRTRRLHFAKQLLDTTDLSMTEVAFAAGFGSLRRFNATFKTVYDRTPSEIRDRRRVAPSPDESFHFDLAYRPPLDWDSMIGYLAGRATPGVEAISEDCYERSWKVGEEIGTLRLGPGRRPDTISLEVRSSSSKPLLALVERSRRLLDLAADPQAVHQHLAQDALLRQRLERRPGLRLPGAWDPFELAVRAILGQQVSVAGATTLAGRLAERYGRPIPAQGTLRFLFPEASALATADIAGIGLPKARAATIQGLARSVRDGDLDFDRLGSEWLETLKRLPGIGEWTAQYIAMRALGEPDAFPAADLGLLRAFERENPVDGQRKLTPGQLLERAEAWRPWRAYAAVHLWAGEND